MNRIKQLRKSKGLTQAQLANEIGVVKQLISYYELEKRHPKPDMWQKLADFFNVSVLYLKGTDDKTIIKKISSEDLLQELIDRKVLEPIDVGLYKEFELKRKYKNRDKVINFDGVFLLHRN